MQVRGSFIQKVLLFGLIVLFTSLLGLGSSAQALEHSGSITADETWLASDNPHEITSNVTVNDLVTLTLEPGVEVIFMGNYWIGVYGAMKAEGTVNSKIRFTRGPGVTSWYGLYLYGASGGFFSHCIIEWAGQRGISAESCYLSVSNSIIRNNDYGIYTSYIQPNLNENLFENNIVGLLINHYYAPSVEEGMVPAEGTINVFRDNDTGLYFSDCMNPVVGVTAVITGSTNYGVHFQNCDRPKVLADITTSGTAVYYQNCTNLLPLEGVSLTDNTGAAGAVLVQGSGPLSLGSGTTIAGNSYPLSIDAASYAVEESQLPASGNYTDAIQVIAGTSQEDATWFDLGLPYVVTGSPTVGASGGLTVESGVRTRLAGGVVIYIYGYFQANGTSENTITFGRDQASRWGSLRFQSGSTGLLSHTIVEFAGNAIDVRDAAPEIANCTLQNNTRGYYGYSNATSSIHDCFIANNDYGIDLWSGTVPEIHQNCIRQNTIWGVQNQTVNVVDAEDNFWGAASGPRHTSNPGGQGDFVSDAVDFDPWLTSCPL